MTATQKLVAAGLIVKIKGGYIITEKGREVLQGKRR